MKLRLSGAFCAVTLLLSCSQGLGRYQEQFEHDKEDSKNDAYADVFQERHGLDVLSELHLDGDQRSLKAVAVLAVLGTAVLSASIGLLLNLGVNELTGFFGSEEVPLDFAVLFRESLEATRNIVKEELANARIQELEADADAASGLYREYIRKADIAQNLADVRELQVLTARLLSALERQAPVIANEAFQIVLALRLAVLVEQRFLFYVNGESKSVIAGAENNIQQQAISGLSVLEEWLATWEPAGARIETRVFQNTVSGITKRKAEETCAFVEAPGLDQNLCPRLCIFGCRPNVTCQRRTGIRYCREKRCKSRHIRGTIRNRRVDRCLSAFKDSVKDELDTALERGTQTFRDRNKKVVFGENIDDVVQNLKQLSDASFVFQPIVVDQMELATDVGMGKVSAAGAPVDFSDGE